MIPLWKESYKQKTHETISYEKLENHGHPIIVTFLSFFNVNVLCFNSCYNSLELETSNYESPGKTTTHIDRNPALEEIILVAIVIESVTYHSLNDDLNLN